MPAQIPLAGGQPQKSPKYAPLYTGRIFSGIWTNRSPLRDAASTRLEEKFYGARGDAMISGSNVEISNRLTLIRRPGNPRYDNTNTYTNPNSFDDFRVNKAVSDVFGTTLEKIFTMVDEPATLFAEDSSFNKRTVFSKTAGAGQSYMQAVGNSLYFGDGIDNKKWLQSLITRTTASDNTTVNTDTYPFMKTFLIDGNNNIQQMIGVSLGTISNVAITSGVLTVTVALSPDTTDYAIGTQFMLWGLTTATFLNGFTLTITAAYTHASSTTLVGNITHTDYATAADTGYIQQENGGVPVTGGSVPTWGTTVPSSSNNFDGSITLDGNILWRNRGPYVENWGIAAPTGTLAPEVGGSGTTGWAKTTYYSPAGAVIDNGNVWQITAAGKSGSTNPFTGHPSPTVGDTVFDGTLTWTCVTTNVGTGNIWKSGHTFDEGNYNGSGKYLPDYTDGSYIIQNAAGTPCLFVLQRNTPPNNINIPISATFGGGLAGNKGWSCKFWTGTSGGAVDLDWGGSVGNPVIYGTSTPKGAPAATADGVTSLLWNVYTPAGGGGHGYDQHPMNNFGLNGAGQCDPATHTQPWPGMPVTNFEFVQYGKIRIPIDGMTVSFDVIHDDTWYFGIESTAGAVFLGGPKVGLGTRTLTPWNGYTLMGGTNTAGASNHDVITINFPTAGVYGMEFCYAQKDVSAEFRVQANNSQITPEQSGTAPYFTSGTNSPAFPGWNTTSASQNTYPNVVEVAAQATQFDNGPGGAGFLTCGGNLYRWLNLGPVTDFAWQPLTNFTVAGQKIIDTNANFEQAYETGTTGLTAPSSWSPLLYALTVDPNPNLQWINEGPVPAQPTTNTGITATSLQGWDYAIALVNTLDNTVSNIGKLTSGTGPIVNGQIVFPAGSGLDVAKIDTQSDYVAIFRTTDGGPLPLLIPSNGNSFYTVPLTQYLQNGYVDTTPDVGLNNLISAPNGGENTPPLPGAVNLSFHLNRIWYSVGNTVYYTSGPLTPAGNGVNGTAPSNYSQLPSLVRRMVPTAIGMLVYTVSDIYIIAGNGTSSNPILPAIPYLTGVGLAGYNALDVNGSIMGFFTTDKQFLVFDPSAGISYAGFPIGDQFRKNNGQIGTSWDPNSVYVAWYVNGEDTGWFVCDGSSGWFKLIPTPAPEVGSLSWSPFATINGGHAIHAIKSVETSPGVHNLLIGPSGTGHILTRDIDATSDDGSTGTNGTKYSAYGVLGSYVLAYPGQIAKIAFITTESVNVGSPMVLGVIIDEALPYFTGSFDILKNWVTDPPNLPPSKSILGQRFYLSENESDSAYCRHLQVLVQWPAEAAQNELQAFTIFGAYEIEA